MKKKMLFVSILVIAFFATACGKSKLDNKESRTYEDLLNGYVDAMMDSDIDKLKKLYPPFYVEYAKNSLTKENLEKSLERAKENFGDDFKITFDIGEKTQLTEDELHEINERMRDYYSAKVDATECYKFSGTITFKGSKSSDTDPLESMGYCKYDGGWYLTEIM